MNNFIRELLFIGKGIVLTLQLLGGGIVVGFILGIFWAICRYQGVATLLINRFISIMRGTPLILQLSLIYFSAQSVTGFRPQIAGIIAFGLNSSAYFAEILRAGIENLPKGQFEAAAAYKFRHGLCGKTLSFLRF